MPGLKVYIWNTWLNEKLSTDTERGMECLLCNNEAKRRPLLTVLCLGS